MSLIDLGDADIEKLVLVEVELGRRLQEQTWTQCGSPNTNVWYLAMPNDGEVHRVDIDGSALTEKFTVALCHATADTFYYDWQNKTLYVHATDSDSPAALDSGDPKYSVVASFWESFSNRKYTVERYIDVLEYANGSLDHWNTSTDVKEWTEVVAGSSTVNRCPYSFVGDETEVYDSDSAFSCKFTGDSSNNDVKIHQTVILGRRRKAKFRFKHYEDSGGTIKISISDSGTNVYLDSSSDWQASGTISISNSTSWTEYEIDFVTHEDYESYVLLLRNNSLTSLNAWIDYVEALRYYAPTPAHVFLGSDSIPIVRQSVGTFDSPDTQTGFGTIRFNNPGWFWDRMGSDYLWHHRKVKLWVGLPDAEYDELIAFGSGRTGSPRFGREVEIDMVDEQIMLNNVPANRYGGSPVEDDWQNRPKPLMFGTVRVEPPEIDTGSYIFQWTDTSFPDGSTLAAKQLDSVYKDSVLQTLTTDYTVNLTNGTFTMVSDPGSSTITCTAYGSAVTVFEVSNEANSLYAILYILYVHLCNIDKYDLDLASLNDLKANRTFSSVAWWITDETTPFDVLAELKKLGVFHTYVSLGGKHRFRAYTSTVPSDAPYFRNEDYRSEPIIEYNTDQCYKSVTAKSDYDFVGDVSSYGYRYEETASEDNVEYEHGVKDRLILETYISGGPGGSPTPLETITSNLLAMYKNPIQTIEVTLGPEALELNPMDKAYFTYTREDGEGNTYTILDEEAHTILSLDKDLNRGEVRVMAMKDVSDWDWS